MTQAQSAPGPARPRSAPRGVPLSDDQLPHDLTDEGIVLAALLTGQMEQTAGETVALVRGALAPEAFYAPPHRHLYTAALDVYDASDRPDAPPDVQAVARLLRERGRLAECGGPAGLARLVDGHPVVADLGEVCARITGHHRHRQIAEELQAAAGAARTEVPTAEWVEELTGRLQAAAGPGRAPVGGLVFAGELAKPLPPVRWFCRALGIGPGRPSIFSGYGGVGKSFAAQAAALAVAAGRGRLWDSHPLQAAGRVAHLDWEQGAWITRWRYQRLAYGMGLDFGALGMQLGTESYPAFFLTDRGAEARLTRLLTGYTLCVVDSLRAACPGVDENSSEIAAPLYLLGRVSEATGCTFVVIAHEGKSGTPGQPQRPGIERLRGSSAIAGAAGSVVSFVKDGPFIRLQNTRSNLGCAADDTLLRLVDEGPIDPTTDASAGVRVEWVPPEEAAAARDAETDPLSQPVARARLAMLDTSRRHGPLSRARLLELTKGQNAALREAFRQLLDEGVLTEAPGPRNARIVRLK